MLDFLNIIPYNKFAYYLSNRQFTHSGLSCLLISAWNPLVPIFFGLNNTGNVRVAGTLKWRGFVSAINKLPLLKKFSFLVNNGLRGEVLAGGFNNSALSSDSLNGLKFQGSVTFLFTKRGTLRVPFGVISSVNRMFRDFNRLKLKIFNKQFYSAQKLANLSYLLLLGTDFYRFSFKEFYFLTFSSFFCPILSDSYFFALFDRPYLVYGLSFELYGLVKNFKFFLRNHSLSSKLLITLRYKREFEIFSLFDCRNFNFFWNNSRCFIFEGFTKNVLFSSISKQLYLRVLANDIFKISNFHLSFGVRNFWTQNFSKKLLIGEFLLSFNCLCRLLILKKSFVISEVALTFLLDLVVTYLVELICFKIFINNANLQFLRLYCNKFIKIIVKRFTKTLLHSFTFCFNK